MNHTHSNHKIGLYVRNSDPKQDTPEGTIKNQEARLRQYIDLRNMSGSFGEIVQVYVDRSLSAKDMNRPAMQQLLLDISRRKINMVAVSELSRITRNMKDFGEVWELLREYKCGFLSLRENVDTSNAAGEMVMFMLANIAQFERKQTSERVAANCKARASRGLYNGGTVPLGYRLMPKKKGYLEVDPERSETVKAAFKYFLKYETLSRTAKKLNEDGIKINRLVQGGGRYSRLDFFTVDNLHNILTNKTYKGIKTYRDGEKRREVKAVWEAIIEPTQFDRVQEILGKNRTKKKPFVVQRYPYILSGLTSCIHCEDVMCGKSAHGKRQKYGYYEHGWASKRGSTLTASTFKCDPHRVPATKLEKVVLDHIYRLMKSPKLARGIIEEAQKIHAQDGSHKEIKRLQAKVSGYNSNLEALAERLSELPKGVSASIIYKQMEKLETAKKEALERVSVLRRESGGFRELPADFKSYQSFLKLVSKTLEEKTDPEVKARIIKRLVHKVEVGVDKVKIHYYAGEDFLQRAVGDMQEQVISGEFPSKSYPKTGGLALVHGKISSSVRKGACEPNGETPKNSDSIQKKAPGGLVSGKKLEKYNFLKNECSSTLTNGTS